MTKALATMSKDERSLLVFLETELVNHGGKVDARHMNADDMAIARQWCSEGFIKFGRIKLHGITDNRTHWVEFSDEAWELAHAERRAIYERSFLWVTIDKVGG